MARPPKPSATKAMQGTDRADRRNGAEPEPDLLDDLTPPAHLSERSAAVWLELAPMLRKMGVLTVADRLALEMLCDSVSDYRLARTELGDDFVKTSARQSPMLNQWLVAKSMSGKRAEAFMSRFGMDPVSRSRVMVNPQGDLFGSAGNPKEGSGRFFQH